jgi:hypothetical protein
MREMNPQFPPSPPETFQVGSDQIDQQNSPDEMATWKNWDLESAPFRRPPDKHALEIPLLRFVNSEMNLSQCPGKDQRHSRRKTHNRQLQGCNDVDEFAQHVPKTQL